MSTVPSVPPAPPEPPIRVLHKLLGYAVENPMKTLGSATSVVGGLMLLVFVTDIGFLPDLDLAGAVSMLYAVALLALALVAAMAGLLILPGPALRGLRGALDPAAASTPAGAPDTPRAQMLPWIVAFMGWAVMLAWQLLGAEQPGALIATVCVALLLVALARWWVHPELANAAALGPVSGLSLERRMWIESGAAFLIFVMPVFVILQLTVVGELGREPVSGKVVLALSLTLAASAAMAYLLSASTPRGGIGIGLAILFALLLLLLVASQTHSVTAIPTAVVRKLGLGDVAFARVALTPSGCRQLNAVLSNTACAVPADAETVTPLCPVRIRSRIGQQLVLEFGDLVWSDVPDGAASAPQRWRASWAGPDQRMRRVVLDKSQMPSWQPLPAVIELDTEPASAASGAAGITLWRSAIAPADEGLRRLCEAHIGPAAPAASAAAPPASAPRPCRACRG